MQTSTSLNLFRLSGFGVYQLARELVCPKSLLVVERPRGDRKATRPKSVWLFPFFGAKGKQAWWNKHQCNTIWKDMKDAIRHGIDLKVAITLADRSNTQPEASVAWFYVGETRACHSKDLCERRLSQV